MSKKVKIPKKIAGVKVPKKLRRKAGKIMAIADNPAVQELAAAAFNAAAVKITEKAKARKHTSAEVEETGPGDIPSPPENRPAGDVDREAAKLADMVRAAALEGARRLIDRIERSDMMKAGKKGSGSTV